MIQHMWQQDGCDSQWQARDFRPGDRVQLRSVGETWVKPGISGRWATVRTVAPAYLVVHAVEGLPPGFQMVVLAKEVGVVQRGDEWWTWGRCLICKGASRGYLVPGTQLLTRHTEEDWHCTAPGCANRATIERYGRHLPEGAYDGEQRVRVELDAEGQPQSRIAWRWSGRMSRWYCTATSLEGVIPAHLVPPGVADDWARSAGRRPA